MSNKKTQLLSMMAMASAFSQQGFGPEGYGHSSHVRKPTEAEIEARKREADKNRNRKNGLTEFFYGDNSVWAINKKTADKKAAKKGYI